MPAKRRVGRPRKRRQSGGSILSKVNDFLKRTKIASTLANAYAHSGGPGASLAGHVGALASQHGYGRSRRRVHRRRR